MREHGPHDREEQPSTEAFHRLVRADRRRQFVPSERLPRQVRAGVAAPREQKEHEHEQHAVFQLSEEHQMAERESDVEDAE